MKAAVVGICPLLAMLALSVLAPAHGDDAASGRWSAAVANADMMLRTAIDRGDLPGCVYVYGTSSQIRHTCVIGDRQTAPTQVPMTLDTHFDLASLTKPIATATAIAILVADNRLAIKDRVSQHLPEFHSSGKDAITVEHLLTHTSGLIPDNALRDYQAGPDDAWRAICELPLQSTPGATFRYSDVGFIVLGQLVQRISGMSLDQFTAQKIFVPLGMKETGFRPIGKASGDDQANEIFAPTERRGGKWLRGEVHDPRAALMGGVAGHAGLFSTADDLRKYAQAVLKASQRLSPPLSGSSSGSEPGNLAPAVAQLLTRRCEVDGQVRSLGFDMQSSYSANRGDAFSGSAIGHGGFTGTVLWIDPDSDRFFVFLSSRLHPDGEGSVNGLSGRIATQLWQAERTAESAVSAE